MPGVPADGRPEIPAGGPGWCWTVGPPGRGPPGRRVGPGRVPRHVLDLPGPPVTRGPSTDRHPHPKCSFPSAGAQQHAGRDDLRRHGACAVSRLSPGAGIAPRARRAGGSGALVLRLRPPRCRSALPRRVGELERQVVTLCPAFFRKPEGDVTFVQHRVARARKNPRAVSAGGDLLPVRRRAVHGAGGSGDPGEDLSGDSRLFRRRSVQLAARNGAQRPLRPRRIRLIWFPWNERPSRPSDGRIESIHSWLRWIHFRALYCEFALLVQTRACNGPLNRGSPGGPRSSRRCPASARLRVSSSRLWVLRLKTRAPCAAYIAAILGECGFAVR